jgi:plastocyanin
LKRAAAVVMPVAVALALLVQGTAFGATKSVTVANFSFTPQAVKVKLADSVLWTNVGSVNHTATSDGVNDGSGFTGIGLWNSGAIAHNGMFSFQFTFAGTYPYHCSIHPSLMTGTVKVPMKATPASGPLGTNFTITWASAAPTGNLVIDVQRKDPGGSFKTWQRGVTTLSAMFKPTATGVYSFRARLRNSNTGAVSKYSPAVSITAT